MKILKFVAQFVLILIFFVIGNKFSEILKPYIFIPGSILGMILMFMSLLSGIIKLSYVEYTSNFFLKYMGFFFIPLGVSLIDSFDLLKSIGIQLIIILTISLILVMGIAGKITEKLILRKDS